MAQTKILVDTNSYLRLAQNLHPLLAHTFGSKDFTLYAHADLNAEFQGSTRIRRKFSWLSQQEYREARLKTVPLSNGNKADLEDYYAHMWDHTWQEQHLINDKGPSEIDTKILATALVLNIYVITDDQDMMELADAFEVKRMTSLELMKLMLDEEHIAMEKVRQVAEQWQYDEDTPYKKWKSEFKALFGESAPQFE